MIRWFADNSIATNFLMLGILLAGLYTALFRVPLEVLPNIEYRVVMIEMPYHGATAKDVQREILIPVEATLEGVDGIKMVNADGHRGYARFYIECKDGYDIRVLKEDVKARIDSISTFPQETERPRTFIPNFTASFEVITVAVTGALPPHELRIVARDVQEDLLELDGISRVELAGARRYEISIEADLARLNAYDLGLRDLANAIRRSSVDLPAGSIRSTSGTLVLRTRGQAYTQEQFERIPVRTANGSDVHLGDVASVLDGFEGDKPTVEFNGEPALFIEVMRTGDESAIEISEKVRRYVAEAAERYPQGINLYAWSDESIAIEGRLSTLVSSLLQGGVLVFIILGLFLRPQLAFWVVMGIPVSFAGGVLLMPWFGVTANIMSLFGYIIVLGIVVDDAIVTSENIYSKLKTGLPPLDAVVQGTKEVTVPVTFGVLTTIVAFLPLLYFEGWWGDFAKQIPPIVGPVLIFSLIESKIILPSHLKHVRISSKPAGPFGRFQSKFAGSLDWLVERVYQPTIELALRHRVAVVCAFVAAALLMAGYCQGGGLGFVALPSADRPKVSAYLDFPDDTSFETTDTWIERILAVTEQLKEEFTDGESGRPLVQNVLRVTGGHWASAPYDKSRGVVTIEVIPPSRREVQPGPKNSAIAKRWTELVGEIPGATSFVVRGQDTGGKDKRRGQDPIELELRGPTTPSKNAIAQDIVDYLKGFNDLTTAWANIKYGQDELEYTLKPRAAELGLTQAALASQVRQAFYGEEAQRLLRDNADIRVMVRLPRRARESLNTLDHLRVRTPTGAEVPLSTVADVALVKSPGMIERNAGAEIIRIGAMPSDETVDIMRIAAEIGPVIQGMVNADNDVSFVFTGHIAENERSKRRTIIGSVALLFALFTLLAIPFKSLVQPLYVLLSVPFGIVGALLGHIALGITPSYLSIFGMLALAGVVVNDALVLVDYVNRERRSGVPLREAVRLAGSRRFRPILLTSLTTFFGLLPLLLDQSIQAQFLIPMAVSLGGGILLSTGITLYLIPSALLLGDDVGRFLAGLKNWFLMTPKQQSPNAMDPELASAADAGEGASSTPT